MKRIIIVLSLAGLTGLGFIVKKKPVVSKNGSRSVTVAGTFEPVAVLELFTSEGCSSCPSADRLLPQLAGLDSNVFPLSFHVDYWNRLGWTDPFSNSEYAERQREYSKQLNLESVYTPQLVINGEYELVGGNSSKAEATIKKVLKEKTLVQLSVEELINKSGRLYFNIQTLGDIKKTSLLAAVVQKKATMKVKAGENSGAILSHTNVVRVLSAQTAMNKNKFELALPENLSDDNWQLIIFAQRKDNLKITGAIVYDPMSR